jgi:hypothetical protein
VERLCCSPVVPAPADHWPGWHAVEHKRAIVDPKLFDAYVGHYQLEPNRIFTVSRVEDRLFV